MPKLPITCRGLDTYFSLGRWVGKCTAVNASPFLHWLENEYQYQDWKKPLFFKRNIENLPFFFFLFNFLIKWEKIESSNSYTYLGVRFSTNGSFKKNKTILKEKTRRLFSATRHSPLWCFKIASWCYKQDN